MCSRSGERGTSTWRSGCTDGTASANGSAPTLPHGLRRLLVRRFDQTLGQHRRLNFRSRSNAIVICREDWPPVEIDPRESGPAEHYKEIPVSDCESAAHQVI